MQRIKAEYLEVLKPWNDLLWLLHLKWNYELTLIFNVDETSLQLKKDQEGKVIYPADHTPGFRLVIQRMPNATLVFGVAAECYSMPSVILWPSQKVPLELFILNGHKYTVWVCGSGWMCMETFEGYVKEILLPEIKARRLALGYPKARALLLIDSHGSRGQLKIWRQFAKLGIDVLTLSSHISEIQQPLDIGMNATFKAVHNSIFELPTETGAVLQRKAVNQALPDSADRALLPSNIRSSFVKAGSLNGGGRVIWMRYPVQPVFPPGVKVNPRQFKGFDYFGKITTDIPLFNAWDAYIAQILQNKKNTPTMQRDDEDEESGSVYEESSSYDE
ncbi:MAG: hypothetical protein EZS28_013998 [Streblomastix strix]|uniref:DDE-1 domain-containing protein n=1 Tax=Streblomastix strix TaxID=222440 RepID=A0A5J4W754_9EUKA|nr:MAG: hypothetical protein EZS28_013998 [Streblomastix strix]